jgi:hypothetical protein
VSLKDLWERAFTAALPTRAKYHRHDAIARAAAAADRYLWRRGVIEMIEKPQPIEDGMYQTMNNIGQLLGGAIDEAAKAIHRRYGFALFVFPLDEGDDGRMNYISNASRGDMLAALKEFIARNEGRYEDHQKENQKRQ